MTSTLSSISSPLMGQYVHTISVTLVIEGCYRGTICISDFPASGPTLLSLTFMVREAAAGCASLETFGCNLAEPDT